MRRFRHSAIAVTVLAGIALAADTTPPPEPQVANPPQQSAAEVVRPRIEVAFVLDTTGSMGGLIAGAKAKIWSITNDMLTAEPTPDIRLALVAYRDRGDAYITQVFDLTEDLDAVYEKLTALQAGGGGDTPESVNQALHEAVNDLSWSESRDVLKVIFLVGDAPPQMKYADDVKYAVTCEIAVKKDIIINTIQCGTYAETTPVWREIAQLSEGSFVQIGQTGDVQVIATPHDDELMRLNQALNATVLPYGAERQQRMVADKLRRSEAAVPASVDRAGVLAKSQPGRAVTGRGDLVADFAAGDVDEGYLAAAPEAELPPGWAALAPEARRTKLEELSRERAALQQQIAELAKKRQAWLDEHRRANAKAYRDSFDEQVSQIVREQASRKNIMYPQEEPKDE